MRVCPHQSRPLRTFPLPLASALLPLRGEREFSALPRFVILSANRRRDFLSHGVNRPLMMLIMEIQPFFFSWFCCLVVKWQPALRRWAPPAFCFAYGGSDMWNRAECVDEETKPFAPSGRTKPWRKTETRFKMQPRWKFLVRWSDFILWVASFSPTRCTAMIRNVLQDLDTVPRNKIFQWPDLVLQKKYPKEPQEVLSP